MGGDGAFPGKGKYHGCGGQVSPPKTWAVGGRGHLSRSFFTQWTALPRSSMGVGCGWLGRRGVEFGWDRSPGLWPFPKLCLWQCPGLPGQGRGLTCYLKPMTNSSLGAALSSQEQPRWQSEGSSTH